MQQTRACPTLKNANYLICTTRVTTKILFKFPRLTVCGTKVKFYILYYVYKTVIHINTLIHSGEFTYNPTTLKPF